MLPSFLSQILPFLLIFAIHRPAQAEADLQVQVDARLASGALLWYSHAQKQSRRSPLSLDLDGAYIFDPRRGIQLSLSGHFPLEDPGVGLTPRLGLLRELAPLSLSLGMGLASMLRPETLYGAEIYSALSYRLSEAFSFLAEFQLDAYLWGADLPEETALLRLDLSLGGRLHL